MAGELHYFGDPTTESGLTLTAIVWSTGSSPAQVGSTVTFTETGSSAVYTGNMPVATSGVYVIRFYSSGAFLKHGEIVWSGSQEATLLTAVPTTAAITSALHTTAMPEAYPPKGSAMTMAQALYSINQQMGEQSISGTTLTVKKRDQSTTAKTYTLDSDTTPSAITEAS